MNDYIQRTETVNTAAVNDSGTISDYLKNRNKEIILCNLDSSIAEYINKFITTNEKYSCVKF